MSLGDPSGKIFSESWHRVAGVRAALRPGVEVHRQAFRQESWYVLRDAMNNQFFRVSEDAYAFLCRLRPDRIVDDAWRETIESDPDTALSQEEIVLLLGQLNMANLLYFDRPATASIFERYRRRRGQEWRSYIMGFLSIKLALLDPDRLLTRALPLIRALYGPLGLGCWLLLLAFGGKVALDNADSLLQRAGDTLSPDNLMYLYVGFTIAKLMHEFSHAAACKRFGGEVHVMGILLVVFTPTPFVDASSSWGFRHRWQRILVACAGMLAEFAVGAIAVIVWANTAPGAVRSVAYNVIFVATVSTLVFNANPLLRLDGYYIFSDLLDVPNLYQRSRGQLRYLGERWLFGVRGAQSPAHSPREGVLLALYGAFSLGYWVLIISGILFFIADQYLDFGMLMAAIVLVTVVVIPMARFIGYLAFSGRLAQQRGRAVVVMLLIGGLAISCLACIDVPDRVRVPGVVEAASFSKLTNQTAGFLVELLAKPGEHVSAGQPLARLANEELDPDIRNAEMQRLQLLAQERRAESTMVADLAPLRQQRAAVEKTLADLRRRRDALLVKAPISGVWDAPDMVTGLGRWLPRGTSLGMIVDNTAHRFVAVVPQVATHVFDDEIRRAEVRLAGEENINLVARSVQVIPFQNGVLPSPALGWAGGGEVAVAPDDATGVTAAEPFFRIHAEFGREDQASPLLHGRLGTMRLTLRERPLLAQWERGIRQFFQRRYRL